MSLPVLAAAIFTEDLPSYKVPYRDPLTQPYGVYYPPYCLPSNLSSPVVASSVGSELPRYKHAAPLPVAWQRITAGAYDGPVSVIEPTSSFRYREAVEGEALTRDRFPDSHLSHLISPEPLAFRALGARPLYNPALSRRLPFGVHVSSRYAPYHRE